VGCGQMLAFDSFRSRFRDMMAFTHTWRAGLLLVRLMGNQWHRKHQCLRQGLGGRGWPGYLLRQEIRWSIAQRDLNFPIRLTHLRG
jgi:hypothetical protein